MKKYDVAIIGSGIAGSTLGAILARNGLSVIIFEANNHPRFAIGESMILETSETMRAMAEIYDIPELAFFSSENYFNHIGTSHGIKRHFSYLHHTANQAYDIQKCLQETTLAYINSADGLISNAYKSFANEKLWSIYLVLWLLGAYLELLKLTTIRAIAKNSKNYYLQLVKLKLVGGDFSEFNVLTDEIYRTIENIDINKPSEVERSLLTSATRSRFSDNHKLRET
ncbi:FAD binding protein [Rivularia sp. PCC 7116]|uniref:NAD(P)/FAD-dependent oxidoreductase n=1 Tax=Rivularia sp. PCC 7116 TaxID=373994 RepID=UPI00029ECD63|nr:NAD(P)-binding protein [Rivularia sp. PCC 7116]AFY56906.1 FAD binding protein [Rivularia sp. PCC 7116]